MLSFKTIELPDQTPEASPDGAPRVMVCSEYTLADSELLTIRGARLRRELESSPDTAHLEPQSLDALADLRASRLGASLAVVKILGDLGRYHPDLEGASWPKRTEPNWLERRMEILGSFDAGTVARIYAHFMQGSTLSEAEVGNSPGPGASPPTPRPLPLSTAPSAPPQSESPSCAASEPT